MIDKRFRIHKLSEQEQTKDVYERFKSDIQTAGYLRIIDGNNLYKVFNAELAIVLSTDKLYVYDTVLNVDTEIDSRAYFNAFKEGYKKGSDYFNNEVKASKEVIYGANASLYIKQLHNNYFNTKVYKDYRGWQFVKTSFPNQLTFQVVEDWGYYSGLVDQFFVFANSHDVLFYEFENQQPSQANAYSINSKNVAIPINSENVAISIASKKVDISPDDNYFIDIRNIVKSWKEFDTKLFDMKFADYANCFNLNYSDPVHPKFKPNQITKFVYFLSQCPEIDNENKVFIARFGIKGYKNKKRNTKPDQVFRNQVMYVLK